jgi:DNA helicase II / ATP-dependent DNA helicase PcrA
MQQCGCPAMMLTSEQKAAVRCDNNVMLTACPGSGKTRVIVSKLFRVVDVVRDTPRAVACITYTNAAVHEIESRLRLHIQPGDDRYFDIGTIHSFCLNNIFRPFCHLIDGYSKGFKVLTPENEEFEKCVRAVCSKFGRYNLTFRDFDDFAQLRLSPDGKPVGNAIDRGGVTPELAEAYWKRCSELGYIDFANIIYYSLRLLRERPEILAAVASRFAWILVDEFQDTTDLQVEILTLIAKKDRTGFLLVGDPFQSIFRFAGARPDLADKFAADIKARTDFSLSGNFRSSKLVIGNAELLFARTPAMEALGEAKKFKDVPSLRHGTSAFAVILDYFLPSLAALKIPIGEAAILAPTWLSLFPLGRRLREAGVSIVGPGARPYRRNRQFAPLAEQLCGYLMEPKPEAIVAIERSLFSTVLDVTGNAHFNIFSYEGRVVVFKLIAAAQKLYSKEMGGVAWLEAAAKAFSDILIECEYLTTAQRLVFAMSVEEMKTDMRNNKVVDLDNLLIDDLGIYATPDAALKLSTLHNSKGREYMAVAMIDCHEGRIPNYYARSAQDLEEQKRLFYVGVTRAKRLLLYATDDSERRNGPSRFLRKTTGVGLLT